ncbi:class I SAM-dependent methyltransferase [Kytococcus sp. Marseille-QA3725]
MADHYFSAAPASADERREIEVELAGRTHRLVTAGGVFSPEHLDHATALLLESSPVQDVLAPGSADAPVLLDVGCGWGPVALSLALQCPGAVVWAVEVNERAADLARENARRLGVLADAPGGAGVTVCLPEEVPADVRFDGLWSNPPIRVGKEVLHQILAIWLPRLRPEGVAHLVVGKNLGAPSLQRWIAELDTATLSSLVPSPVGVEATAFTCERVARHKAFWVLEARPAPGD